MIPTTSPDSVDRSELLTLPRAARVLPGNPHASTLWRWCRKGVKTRAGHRIRLEHQRLGRTIYVTREAIDAFARALAAADMEQFDAEEAAPRMRSPAERRRAVERANKGLAAAGW